MQDWHTQRTAVQQELQQHEVQLQAAAEAALQLLEEQVGLASGWHTVAMLLTIHQACCQSQYLLAAPDAFSLPMHSMTCALRVSSEPDHAVVPRR